MVLANLQFNGGRRGPGLLVYLQVTRQDIGNVEPVVVIRKLLSIELKDSSMLGS